MTWYVEPVRDRPRVDPVAPPRRARQERTEAEREATREGPKDRRRERREQPEDDGLPHIDVLA